MFENLTSKFGRILDSLKGKSVLKPADVEAVVAGIKTSLLEADSALEAADALTTRIKDVALRQETIKGVSPSDQITKIVYDEMLAILGEPAQVNIDAKPTIILMAGLQGSGKTTTSAKLAKYLTEQKKLKVLLASIDVQRPAAREQLAILATSIGTESFPITQDSTTNIAKAAVAKAKLDNFDVVILDSAGRLSIDQDLMKELQEVVSTVHPNEILLVLDAMMGHDAINVATTFKEVTKPTGLVMTRLDGDARGGAILSATYSTGLPIKFVGSGEQVSDLQLFNPKQIASRILDIGDIDELTARIEEHFSKEDTEKLADKLMRGEFNFEDMLKQMRTLAKMGGLSSVMGLLPKMGQFKDKLSDLKAATQRSEAIILSMTKAERKNPALLHVKRKQRIARGSGTSVSEVEKLIKQLDTAKNSFKNLHKLKNMVNNGNPLGGKFPF